MFEDENGLLVCGYSTELPKNWYDYLLQPPDLTPAIQYKNELKCYKMFENYFRRFANDASFRFDYPSLLGYRPLTV